ncbi:MAG: acyloxyacyl hydrolase [Flavobacteriales bacterium]|nr:acyloxyacyl hydrolase [Flavobacteriales bacterium]
MEPKRTPIILLLISLVSFADDLQLRTGLGRNPNKGKIVAVNYSRPLSKELKFLKSFDFLYMDAEIGGLNPVNFLTSHYTMFGSIGVAFKIKSKPMYAQFIQSVAVISDTNRYLNTHYQFPTTLSGGLWHKNGNIGVFWKHFSNGSGSPFNVGANYLGLEMGWSFGTNLAKQ